MRRTDPAIKKALLAKLGVTPQRLSQLVAALKKELGPMDTADAVYAIASLEGIDIASRLSAEEADRVRRIVAEARAARAAAVGPAAKPEARAPRGAPGPKPALVSIGGVNVERLPGMPARTAQEAKTMSEKVYPMIYVFENSARSLISTLMEHRFGSNWWEEEVPKRIREAAAKKKAEEQKDPWHGRRGAAMIDYTLLSELPAIVNHSWRVFKPIFERTSFFEELVANVNVSRRVIAHMNPVSGDDVRHIESAFQRWAKTLKAKKDLIPGL